MAELRLRSGSERATSGYYAMQWMADGRHSAVAQFSKTGGVAWTLAAIGGGAVIGLFGGLASGAASRVDGVLAARIHARTVARGVG